MAIAINFARQGHPHSAALASTISAILPLAFGILIGSVIWLTAAELSADAKIVLIVIIFAMIGWVATRLPDSLVALLAALALVVSGAQPQEALTDTLGEKIVWLLLAAFVIAAVIKEAGLAERLVAPLTQSAPRILSFFLMTGAAISSTAFLLPSTSGRAALLLPVFLGLVTALPDRRLAKPLALLFPTAILLSAGGSLIGAGAHVVAVEAISASGGPAFGYLDWLMIGAPLAFASVLAATLLIFVLFVPQELRNARLKPSSKSGQLTKIQHRILWVLSGVISLWIVKPLHGLDETIVALGGAVLLLLPPFCTRKPKDVFRSVDVELVLYMTATLMLSVAVIDTGLDRWLAAGALSLLPAELATHSGAVVLFLSAVAVASHLAITSRSARAAILIPALALPVAGLGHDATLAILIAVMGTGFCQTLMASAKPVAIFGMHDQAGFTQTDLFRLALPLAPLKIVLLMTFALWVWPHQIAKLAPNTSDAKPIATYIHVVSSSQRAAIATAPQDFSASATPVSLRPKERPEAFARLSGANATPSKQPTAAAQTRVTLLNTMRRDVRRARQDLRATGKQLERDLSRLFQ
ncbi:SLC13 family permease [Ruegeria jejuensis]|uniref:SLC13 family permease n=1 Tax=Ruegeria jejuensis TaxID=3233338 RepID=UPI00355C89C4